jgi:hypothetical protein
MWTAARSSAREGPRRDRDRGGSGIGRASALGFAAARATAVDFDVDDAAGAETVRVIMESSYASSCSRQGIALISIKAG